MSLSCISICRNPLRAILKNNYCFKRILNPWSCHQSRHKSDVSNDKDLPVCFTKSPAGTGNWSAKYTMSGPMYYSRPKSESYVIAFSLTIFMIWFGILREENDLDDWVREMEINSPKFQEENALYVTVSQGIAAGKDVSKETKRLKELILSREEKWKIPKKEE